MNTDTARRLFETYRNALAYVITRTTDGDEAIGTSFHVGGGVFVTARHVVDGRRIVGVGLHSPAGDGFRGIDEGPFLHPDPSVDVAAFRLFGFDGPHVPLGGHLDDWLNDGLVLTSAVVLGYPPIPFAAGPQLVAVSAEVNAIIDPRHTVHPVFIISAMARGGFSGGVVVSEYDFALGVVSESLVRDGLPAELGFFSVLSVEPIYACLAAHKILPKEQDADWGDLFNKTEVYYLSPASEPRTRIRVGVGDLEYNVPATLAFVDNGRRSYLEVNCGIPALMERVLAAAKRSMGAVCITSLYSDGSMGWVKVCSLAEHYDPEAVRSACREADDIFVAEGFRRYHAHGDEEW